MLYNKYVNEFEIEYYNIKIPCLYNIDATCVHKCKEYWSYLTDTINNKHIPMKQRKQQIMMHNIEYPDICYRIDSYYCDERFCHYWYCTHHYFPKGNERERWDRSIKLTSND